MNRSSNFQNRTAQPAERLAVIKPKVSMPAYDASRFIKKDLVLSALVAGVVIAVGFIFYIFLR
jgi:hypothetical protein